MKPLKPVSGRWNPISTHPKDEMWYKCAIFGELITEPLMWRPEHNAFCSANLQTQTYVVAKNQPSHYLELPKIEWPAPPKMVLA